MLCEICLEEYAAGEFQQLACSHSFCNTCISLCTASVLCPSLMCSAVRSMDIVVDEADDPLDPDLEDQDDGESGFVEKHHNRIAFAARLPHVMRLEEKQRCEARKGRFQCVNVARLTLTSCHHSICFDCLGKRLERTAKYLDVATCPIARCGNRVSKTEVKRLAERSTGFTDVCAKITGTMKDDVPAEERPLGKDEMRVYCSIYGNDLSTRLTFINAVCTFGDMVNAFMQVLKLDKSCLASELHIYVRTITESGKSKFEQIHVKQMAKKSIRDSFITDKSHVVFDLKNEIGRL